MNLSLKIFLEGGFGNVGQIIIWFFLSTYCRELSSHVESVQGEIDYLKEVLKGEGYSFDANTLLGVSIFDLNWQNDEHFFKICYCCCVLAI